MREFRDKVAVITGGASGIGRALTERCVREGMKVVLADVEEEALQGALKEIKGTGADVIGVRTDVSNGADVEALSQKTLEAFGAVHLLFNNAGVTGSLTNVWQAPLEEWEWILGVNLWGVIHGIRVFLPIMLKQDMSCYIVNTASISGVTAGPGLGPYKVSKHGVVALSETLYHELTRIKARVGVSVLCPWWVNTRMADSDRNRPKDYRPARDPGKEGKGYEAVRKAIAAGMAPEKVADIVFDAIMEEKFYVLTDKNTKLLIQLRAEDMLQERNPTNPLQ